MGYEVEFDKCIGCVVSGYRKDSTMSIDELAVCVGRSVADLRKYEAGYNLFGASLFIKICSVLELDMLSIAEEARELLCSGQRNP